MPADHDEHVHQKGTDETRGDVEADMKIREAFKHRDCAEIHRADPAQAVQVMLAVVNESGELHLTSDGARTSSPVLMAAAAPLSMLACRGLAAGCLSSVQAR